jgi:ubiquinone/menaquinone biosynthesis C-methylase UbiE
MMLSRLDRARYQLQHGALLLVLGPYMGAWHWLVRRDLPRPTKPQVKALRARLADLLARDLENVERGAYPRELLFGFPAAEYLRRLPELVREPPRVLWRIFRGAYEELPGGIDLGAFPRYYRRTFHWQSDGWLSSRSAALYDLEVEALFAGTGDVMRRMALPPLVNHLRGKKAPRVLDVACGTGRFLRHLLEAAPHARASGLDLSPYYLSRAHQLLEPERAVSLVADNAEHMPFRSDHFEAASAVFLLHELPPRARRRVLTEAHRVLAPGGRLVVCDSAQLSDSPELRPFLEGFPKLYHEPYFKGYLRDDLPRLLERCGFEVESQEPAFLAKVVVARKRDARRRRPRARGAEGVSAGSGEPRTARGSARRS